MFTRKRKAYVDSFVAERIRLLNSGEETTGGHRYSENASPRFLQGFEKKRKCLPLHIFRRDYVMNVTFL